jgi:hypothetical protein
MSDGYKKEKVSGLSVSSFNGKRQASLTHFAGAYGSPLN